MGLPRPSPPRARGAASSSPRALRRCGPPRQGDPPGEETSVVRLAAYLARPGYGEAQRARALFTWVASHVDYDRKALVLGETASLTPEEVLARRTTVCEGYSTLFEALARAAGMEAVTIWGYAKGTGYRAGAAFTGPANHAWNAVRVDGQWRLVDCTWGAGALDESGVYVRAFEPFYCFTPPDRFLYTHWPKEARWQLVDAPLSKEAFEGLPWIKPAFFAAGLGLRGGQTVRQDGAAVRLALDAPGQQEMRVYLLKDDVKLGGGALPLLPDGRGFQVMAGLPGPGAYVLRVYAALQGAPGTLEWAADIPVRSP